MQCLYIVVEDVPDNWGIRAVEREQQAKERRKASPHNKLHSSTLYLATRLEVAHQSTSLITAKPHAIL